LSAGETTSSAKQPTPANAITRSPGDTCVTPSPTAITSPAASEPGVKGSDGWTWYFFWMISTSGKLTPAARTRTRTSPGPGSRAGTSRTTSRSAGPHCSHSTARIAASSFRSGPVYRRRAPAPARVSLPRRKAAEETQ
jgi:hypothetical protein